MRVHPSVVADRRGSPSPADREARFVQRVGSYHARWRRAVADVARFDPAVEDLAESYPALLFALAGGAGEAAARPRALTHVQAGAPLDTVATTLKLAPWMRKLPAAALIDPLPAFPMDADFSRRMSNLVPPNAAHAAAWLTAVAEAQLAGGRTYTLWVARHGLALTATLSDARRQLLHTWVWSSWHPGLAAFDLIRRPWSADSGIKRVMEEFHIWLHRVSLADWLGLGRTPPWVEDGDAHGYGFHTLATAAEFIATAHLLDNCLEQYADRLRTGISSVVVVTEQGTPVACLELEPFDSDTRLPAIKQLRTAKNKAASPALWQAVYAWLGSAALVPMPNAYSDARQRDRDGMREQFWGPYLSELAAVPGGAPVAQRARAALYDFAASAALSEDPRRLRRLRALYDWGDGGRGDPGLLHRLTHLLPRTPNRGG